MLVFSCITVGVVAAIMFAVYYIENAFGRIYAMAFLIIFLSVFLGTVFWSQDVLQ
jgi:hypothetical protein